MTYAVNNRPPHIDIPTHSMPAENARDNFLQAAAMWKKAQRTDSIYYPDPRRPETIQDYKMCAHYSGPVLALIRQGLSKPFVAPPDRGKTEHWKDLSEYRSLGRLLRGAAAFYDLTGHPDRALEIQLDCAEMAVLLPSGDGVGAVNASASIQYIALTGTEQTLLRASEAALTRAAERLERIQHLRRPFADAVIEDAHSEASSWQAMFREARTVSARYDLYREQVVPYDQAGVTKGQMLKIARVAWADKQSAIAAIYAYRKVVAEETRGPFKPAFSTPIPTTALYGEEWDLTMSFWRGHVDCDMSVEILRVEIALERYRKAYDEYPRSLSDLVPRLLRSAPTDLFGGPSKPPLGYTRLSQSRYRLYSVGNDMRDDGGTPAKHYSGFPEVVPAGDLVAGHLYPARKAQ